MGSVLLFMGIKFLRPPKKAWENGPNWCMLGRRRTSMSRIGLATDPVGIFVLLKVHLP